MDGGGALMNQGIHTVDLLLWLCGPVVGVMAVAVTALHRIEVEDTVVATLEFASGAVGTLEVTTAAYPGLARRVTLTGTAGTVVVDGDRIADVRLREACDGPPAPGGSTSPSPIPSANPSTSAQSPVVSDVSGHRRIIEDLAAAVRDGRRPCCDGADGRRSVAVVDAIYRAAATGLPVTL